MRFPEYEGKAKIPAGHYQFRLNKEPELIAFDYNDPNSGEKKKGRKVKIYAVGICADGEYYVIDAIPVWDERYADFKEALGINHSNDVEVAGSIFEADIVYESPKNDPTKSYAQFVNITRRMDVPENVDDVPF